MDVGCPIEPVALFVLAQPLSTRKAGISFKPCQGSCEPPSPWLTSDIAGMVGSCESPLPGQGRWGHGSHLCHGTNGGAMGVTLAMAGMVGPWESPLPGHKWWGHGSHLCQGINGGAMGVTFVRAGMVGSCESPRAGQGRRVM